MLSVLIVEDDAEKLRKVQLALQAVAGCDANLLTMPAM